MIARVAWAMAIKVPRHHDPIALAAMNEIVPGTAVM